MHLPQRSDTKMLDQILDSWSLLYKLLVSWRSFCANVWNENIQLFMREMKFLIKELYKIHVNLAQQ